MPTEGAENPQAGPGTVTRRPLFSGSSSLDPSQGACVRVTPFEGTALGTLGRDGSALGRPPPPRSHGDGHGVLQLAGPWRVAGSLLARRLFPGFAGRGFGPRAFATLASGFRLMLSLLETTGLSFWDRGQARPVEA